MLSLHVINHFAPLFMCSLSGACFHFVICDVCRCSFSSQSIRAIQFARMCFRVFFQLHLLPTSNCFLFCLLFVAASMLLIIKSVYWPSTLYGWCISVFKMIKCPWSCSPAFLCLLFSSWLEYNWNAIYFSAALWKSRCSNGNRFGCNVRLILIWDRVCVCRPSENPHKYANECKPMSKHTVRI